MLKSQKNILAISVYIIAFLIVIVLIYGLNGKTKEGLYPDGIFGPWNIGTRELVPTHLMSYDIRGDVPITYQPIGVFNQPEYPTHASNKPLIEEPTIMKAPVENKKMIGVSSETGNPYYIEPNFYTYDYVNPLVGVVPPVFNSSFSIPYKT
jgi:hypothetical protein